MPLYSEVLSNESIIAELQGKYEKIAIIGCGACTNESLAYKNSLPVFDMDESGNKYPCATVVELERLRAFLVCTNYQVETKCFNDINGFVCMRKNKDADTYSIVWHDNPNVILALCCTAGSGVIKELFPDIPVVCITRPIATLFYSYSDHNGKRLICKDNSMIFPFY